MASPSTLRYLQGWIGVVGLMALGNTISCFRDHRFLSERLYTGATEEVNPLMARLFGTWTLLSALLRIYCAYDVTSKPIFHLTFVSFILAFGHFMLEAFWYKTAPITIGVIAPLVVSGVSIVWMLVCWNLVEKSTDEESEIDNAGRILLPRRKKQPKSD